jgi:hypothetical protein
MVQVNDDAKPGDFKTARQIALECRQQLMEAMKKPSVAQEEKSK